MSKSLSSSARPRQTQAGAHKRRIVETAARLFRRQGYAATGLNEILATAQAPKGSLYHYFPGGKDALGAAAVAFGSSLVERTLTGLAAREKSAAAVLLAFADALSGWLEASEFRDGCPISTVLLETVPESTAIAEAGCTAFANWRAIFEDKLLADGVADARARALSALAVAALEGGLLLARTERSARPLLDAAEEAAAAMQAARP